MTDFVLNLQAMEAADHSDELLASTASWCNCGDNSIISWCGGCGS